jgi:glycosyltransferase involved in cell wall biosynthesis
VRQLLDLPRQLLIVSVDILLPTYNRPLSLAITLAGIAAQSLQGFRLVVADQSDEAQIERPEVLSLQRNIEARGHEVEWHSRPQVHGIAEQRDFLLKQARADYVLFLDDDVFTEPWVTAELDRQIRREGCGFIGAFPTGLSFKDDERPDQQAIEFWDGGVQPEAIEPGMPQWERWQLHRAANLYHVARRLHPPEPRLYKVAWVACCVIYDRRKLEAVGGFSFWDRLPRYHSGEEVLVQNLLMRRWGGCGMLPSGTYHSELPSTVLNEAGGINGHALDLLPELKAEQERAAGSPH